MMPKTNNNTDIARHARRSFDLGTSSSPSFCAEIQQLPEARRYNATVTQPPMVGSPIPGVQLKWVTHASYMRGRVPSFVLAARFFGSLLLGKLPGHLPTH